MDLSMLHVLHFTLSSETSVADALRAARHVSPKGKRRCVLLFAFLRDADAESLPLDAPMLKKLQSGVMAMNARSKGEFLLLVPRRMWDDASRAYLGEKRSCKEVVAQLIKTGETDAVFAAATVSPSSLKGRFSHILFSDLSLSCTPDMPDRMLEALDRFSSGCVCAHIRERNVFPQTALARVCKGGPFALSPLLCAKTDRLLRKGFACPDAPILYTAEALVSSPDAPA
ncbi:MAG: hypothetical protein IJV91_10835, partial [Kiritimatiellae bacterium]|nr:hypothetical protein [Kiritimatiellia bacterium]